MFNVEYFLKVLPLVASKSYISLEITFLATILALIIAVVIAVAAYYRVPVLHQICRAFVEVMRGTPIVTQIYFFYFGIAVYSTFVRNMTPLIAVTFVIALNTGAFMSESIRAALNSVDDGQREAGIAFGMTNLQVVRRVILPQAVRIALPPLFNDIIGIIKATAFAFMLGVPDIMGIAKIEGASSYRFFEIYAAVMVVYFVIIEAFSIISRLIEKKCSEAY